VRQRRGLMSNYFDHLFSFYDWPSLHVCTQQGMLFSALILGSVFSNFIVFYQDNKALAPRLVYGLSQGELSFPFFLSFSFSFSYSPQWADSGCHAGLLCFACLRQSAGHGLASAACRARTDRGLKLARTSTCLVTIGC